MPFLLIVAGLIGYGTGSWCVGLGVLLGLIALAD